MPYLAIEEQAKHLVVKSTIELGAGQTQLFEEVEKTKVSMHWQSDEFKGFTYPVL